MRVEGVTVRTVAVVDDHRTFAELLALALDGHWEFRFVDHATTAAQARTMIGRHAPDIVLMDVELPDGDGIELTRELRESAPQTRIVVLTSHNSLSLASRAVAAGAAAFYTKDGSLADLLQVLRTLDDGPVTITAPRTGRAARTPDDLVPVDLAARELEVLSLMAQGCGVDAMARRMGITRHTCRGYVKSMYLKLGVHSQLEALVAGLARGLIEPPAPRHGSR